MCKRIIESSGRLLLNFANVYVFPVFHEKNLKTSALEKATYQEENCMEKSGCIVSWKCHQEGKCLVDHKNNKDFIGFGTMVKISSICDMASKAQRI